MNLTELFTSIANAIRTKKGTTELINAVDFPSEIANLPSGSSAKITDGYQLFYEGRRTDYANELLSLCENITSTKEMFYFCIKLTELDVSNLDTSNVNDMESMFRGCSDLTELDLSKWDTSNVNNMYETFSDCPSLTELDVSNWNTSNVNDMGYMFSGCSGLTELDLSKWDTSNVNTMSRMFYACSNLTKLDIRNFTFDKVTSYNNMFRSFPVDCLIIVKGDTEKQWVLTVRSDLTNVKTVAELGG